MAVSLEPEKSLQGAELWRVWLLVGPRIRTLSNMSLRLENPRDEIAVDPAQREATRRDVVALLGWFALISGVAIGGQIVNEIFATNVLAPPLFGRFDVRVGPATLLVVTMGCAIVWFGPRVVSTIPWRILLLVTALAAGSWALSLAMVDGVDALSAPLSGPHDYLVTVERIDSPGTFLETFVDRLETYSLHVQGHPPGMVLVFWGLAWLGLVGAAWAAVLVIGVGVSATAAALLTVKAISGETNARRLAPFLALSPAAIWIATSADAFFMGVGAWGIALLALGAERRSDYLSLAGGLVLGLALFLSYGAVALAPVAVVAAAAHRGLRPLLVATGGVFAIVALFGVAGFWWFDGLSSTVAAYEAGVASQRPFAWFAVANLAAFALALGPAAAVGLGRLHRAPTAALTCAALIGVMAVDLSGLSKGEVERIWLILVPWVLAICVTFDLRRCRGMLALQGLAALAIQTGVRTPW
jgi:methylthioxylose transferase